MAELDLFEARFDAAYRAYLGEVPVEVDAAVVAQDAATRARRPGFRRRLGELGTVGRVAILAAILLAALAVAAGVGALRHQELTSDLPAGMAGTWYQERDDGTPFAKDVRTMTLADCMLGDTCGRLVVRDEAGRCEYALTLRDLTPAGAVLEIGSADSFRCGWSQWPQSRREARLVDATTLEVGSMSLRRVGGPALPPDPAALVIAEIQDPRDVAREAPDISSVTARMTQDQLVLEIELVRPVPEGHNWNLRGFLDPDRTGSCNAWVSAYSLDAGFAGGSETTGARLRYEPQTFGTQWFGTPGRMEAESHELVTHLAGPWATVWIPLNQLASPREIGFMVFAVSDGPDIDDVVGSAGNDLCYSLSLPGG